MALSLRCLWGGGGLVSTGAEIGDIPLRATESPGLMAESPTSHSEAGKIGNLHNMNTADVCTLLELGVTM